MGFFTVSSRLLAAFSILFLAQNCVREPSRQPPAQPVGTQKIEKNPTEPLDPLIADLDNSSRAIWQKPELVIDLLGDLEGKTVADIGAGAGYFSFRLAPKARRVIAVDIDPQCTAFMDSVKVRLPESMRFRFETRLARPDDPLLQPAEADAAIIVNTYCYLKNRSIYLKTLQKGMAPGGRLLIIDFKKGVAVGPPEAEKVSMAEAEKELRAAGFLIEKADAATLDYQYILLAKNKKP